MQRISILVSLDANEDCVWHVEHSCLQHMRFWSSSVQLCSMLEQLNTLWGGTGSLLNGYGYILRLPAWSKVRWFVNT